MNDDGTVEPSMARMSAEGRNDDTRSIREATED
jgi:hypothetical protein